MMRTRRRLVPVLFLGSIAVLCVAWGSSASAVQAGDLAGDVAHVVELTTLDAGEVDALLALPAVDGWIEFGDQAVLFGGMALADLLADRYADVTLSSLAVGDRTPWVVTGHGHVGEGPLRKALQEGRDGLALLAGRGRHALLLASAAVVRQLQTAGVELNAVAPGTVVVQRLDRLPAPATPKAASAPIVHAAVEAVDLAAYSDVVTDLVAFGTRFTHHASFPNVTNYLAQELTDLGFSVTLDPFQIGGNTRHNVIAEIPGDVTPDDVVLVCGHYDSTSQTPNSSAPGADDNASGTAAVIEMARVLSQYRFESTVRFACFAGEEQGLVGSSTYVNDLIAAGELGNLQGVINMDMIAYLNTGTWDVLLEGQAGASAALLDLLPGLVTEHTSLTGFVSTNPYGSDHMPFINNGVNAVLTIEYQDWFNPNYHSTNDTLATLTLPFAVEIIKLNVAAVATMAGIHGGYMLEYGAGLAGSGGYVPDQSGSGSANLGQSFEMRLDDGLGGALGYLVLGTASASLPKFGGTLLVGPLASLTIAPVTLGGAAAPGAGWFDIRSEVPNDPGLLGVSVFLQYVIADPGAPHGKSLSDGLEFVIGI